MLVLSDEAIVRGGRGGRGGGSEDSRESCGVGQRTVWRGRRRGKAWTRLLWHCWQRAQGGKGPGRQQGRCSAGRLRTACLDGMTLNAYPGGRDPPVGNFLPAIGFGVTRWPRLHARR